MTAASTIPFRPARPERVPRPLPAWRQFFGELKRNPLMGWPELAFEQLYWYRPFLTLRYHLVSDPEAIGRVFLDNAANYGKPGLIRRMLAPLVGESLLLAEGDDWKDQRRLMAPVFTPHAVAEFMPIFLSVAGASADRWTRTADGRIDGASEATRATFEVIGEALFSGEPALASDEASEHIHAILAGIGEYRIGSLLGLPWLDRSAIARHGDVGRRYLIDRLANFIRARQENPAPPADFMTRVLTAFAERHPPEAAAKLALDNAVTFFVAGHETTANALAWSLYLLSQDQTVQDKAAAEAHEAFAAGGAPEEILGRLTYVKMVLEEAMRLYPPVHRIEREALADDILGGHRVRKGDMIAVWPWVVHRHARLWAEPDAFDPENFSAGAKAARHRFQYLPFGAGPRICIGMSFALAEGALILAAWLDRFRFRPDPEHQVFPTADVTLRPRGGLPLLIEARETALIAAT